MEIGTLYNLCEQLYIQRDNVLAHMEPCERESIAGKALGACDDVMYLQGNPDAMYASINAFAEALRKAPNPDYRGLGDVAPDSTPYIDAYDLAHALQALLIELAPNVNEQADHAVALLWGALDSKQEAPDIISAVIDLVRECIKPQA